MKLSKMFPITGVLCMASVQAAVTITTTQDGWIDHNDGSVKDAGTGDRLNIATPNPSGASQFSRVAYFGFDVSSVDLTQVTSITFNATAASNISGYNGANDYRFYLVDNTITDNFDETTLTDGNAPGHTNGNRLTGQQTAGTIVGDVAVAATASGQSISLNFSAASLADLANDTNGFLTIVAEYRGQNNAGYGGFTGLGFESKDMAGGTAATLDIEVAPEPASTSLLGLGLIGFLLRRKR